MCDSITLLAVSKGQTPQHACVPRRPWGLREFGENYLPEALPKIQALRDLAPVWHFIGRLQANKTRAVAEHFSWVHSVDRLKIAERLSLQRPHFAPPLNVCVQVNVLGEAAKGGVAPGGSPDLLAQVASAAATAAAGPDVHAALRCNPGAAARGIRATCTNCWTKRGAGLDLDTLSMGMSADLEQAIQEGSTLVRIGTALFGERA